MSVPSGKLQYLLARWKRLSLTKKFALAGSAVLVVGMMVIGYWVAEKIESRVVDNTAVATAFYMDSFVAPLLQELAERDRLSSDNQNKLDALLQETPIGKRVVAVKVWDKSGVIIYSNKKDLVGKKFPITDLLRGAWGGAITADFDHHTHEEDEDEPGLGAPLLEIYSPIRAERSDRIIAVAEFYAVGTTLKSDLQMAFAQSWFVVGFVTLLMMAALFSIVVGGSRTIEHQQRALHDRVHDLSRLLKQNETLRSRIQRASKRAAETNERFLRRIGSDLHDGPCQLLGLSLLRLDSLKASMLAPDDKNQTSEAEFERIRNVLSDALSEMRDISAGLALPELDDASAAEAVGLAVRGHERRTGTAVQKDINISTRKIPIQIKICLYRFAQEALNNAYRHANGSGQSVHVRGNAKQIEIVVSDHGPGLGGQHEFGTGTGLGLSGLRDRVETLGGWFTIHSSPGQGTSLMARFNLHEMELSDAG